MKSVGLSTVLRLHVLLLFFFPLARSTRARDSFVVVKKIRRYWKISWAALRSFGGRECFHTQLLRQLIMLPHINHVHRLISEWRQRLQHSLTVGSYRTVRSCVSLILSQINTSTNNRSIRGTFYFFVFL